MKIKLLAFGLFVLCMLAMSAQASATQIWGRITGLGGFSASNYIKTVKIVTDRGEVFWGNTAYLQGPGLIWRANVPNRTRNYTVYVTATDDIRDQLYWQTEIAFGFWMAWDFSRQCTDIRFWRR